MVLSAVGVEAELFTSLRLWRKPQTNNSPCYRCTHEHRILTWRCEHLMLPPPVPPALSYTWTKICTESPAPCVRCKIVHQDFEQVTYMNMYIHAHKLGCSRVQRAEREEKERERGRGGEEWGMGGREGVLVCMTQNKSWHYTLLSQYDNASLESRPSHFTHSQIWDFFPISVSPF